MLALLRPERGRYACGLLSLLVVNVTDVLGPLFLALAIDLVASGAGVERAAAVPRPLAWLGVDAWGMTLAAALGAFLALLVATNVFRYPMLMLVSVPSHRVAQGLRNTLVDHLLRLSRPFYDRAKSGELMSLATSDIAAARMFYGPGILLLVDTVLLMVLVLAAMFAMSWPLALAAIVPLPLIALFTNRFTHAEFDRFEAVQADVGKLTERAREMYAGIRIVQGYAREEHQRRRFAEHSRSHFRLNLRLARVRSLFDPSLDLALGLSTVLVLVVGGVQLAHGTISLGTFVAFLFLVGNLSGPMIGFGWAASLFQRGRASMKRIDALLGQPVEIRDAPDARPADGPGALEVRGLTFAYSSEEGAAPALSEVSFRLDSGRRLGVVGPVGSGKTTLVSLLVRLYEPPLGTVLLDGVDVRDVALASLRRTVVVAPQDTFLFGDTVERNLRLAPEAAGKDPLELARPAHVDKELAALPHGVATLLGERGFDLSGGQRQRVAIARAIGADPRVLVLDDCLAAVDARTEAAILDDLERVLAGRSGVIVSHRVRAVRDCDEILVLDGGRVVDRGTHDELFARDGWYRQIALEQMREDAAP